MYLSIQMCLLNVYHAPGAVVSTDNTKMSKTGILPLRNSQSSRYDSSKEV